MPTLRRLPVSGRCWFGWVVVSGQSDFNVRNRALFERRAGLLSECKQLEAVLEDGLEDGDAAAADDDAVRRLRRLRRSVDDVTQEIVESNYGLVMSYVSRFTASVSAEVAKDYEAAGRLGLMRAVSSFDPDKGRFGAWAYKPIQREVLRAVRDVEYANMNPGDFEKRPAILQAFRELQVPELSNGPVPEFDDVADVAGVTLAQVSRVLAAPVLDSLSAPLSDDGTATVGDTIPDAGGSLEDQVFSVLEVTALAEFGFSVLDERERFVLTRRFGLDCEPVQKLSSIGAMLELSREAVRQIEARALAKLGHPVTLRRLLHAL